MCPEAYLEVRTPFNRADKPIVRTGRSFRCSGVEFLGLLAVRVVSKGRGARTEAADTMDARYINPFVASVKNVFKTMLATELVVGKPFITPPSKEPDADVSAVIGLSGDAVGCVVLSYVMETAVKAASRFAGTDLDSKHPDFADALGELANMVAGHAKAQMADLDVSISLPSVVIGAHHIVSQSKQSPRLALPCDSDLGRFHVEVAMEVGKKTTAPRPLAAVGAKA